MAEVAVSRQMFVDILSLIAWPGAPPAPMWGGWRSDATADKRFDAGKSALFAARRNQLIGSIVCHADETRFVVAQAARTRDRRLAAPENPGNASSWRR